MENEENYVRGLINSKQKQSEFKSDLTNKSKDIWNFYLIGKLCWWKFLILMNFKDVPKYEEWGLMAVTIIQDVLFMANELLPLGLLKVEVDKDCKGQG